MLQLQSAFGVLALLAMIVVKKVIPDPVISRFHSDTEASPASFASVLRNTQLLRLNYGIFALHAALMALWLVASGEPYVSAVFRGTVIDRGQIGSAWHKLTPAELRIFAAIGDGSGNEEAATRLGLSEATVQTHRRNLMHKLGISSSAKLVKEAIRLGVVQIMADGRVIRPGLDETPRSFPTLRHEESARRTIELK